MAEPDTTEWSALGSDIQEIECKLSPVKTNDTYCKLEELIVASCHDEL